MVGPGEDLWRISRTYEIDAKTITEFNEILNPDDIKEGDKIFIPGARKVLEVPPPTYEELAEVAKKGLFIWPVEGMIYSLFGPRWGRMHNGIDISAPVGTPVSTSRGGDVVFVGWKGGYGKVVEIKHDEHYMTVYAHLSKIFVEEGDSVKDGGVIGNVGCTGRCTGPHLHFEIRYDDIPRNPLYFLP
jgi:murein DD-endopeptidase MepM/ murein hydrolase activator NlpD